VSLNDRIYNIYNAEILEVYVYAVRVGGGKDDKMSRIQCIRHKIARKGARQPVKRGGKNKQIFQRKRT
jgi:uncharacterized Fe-S cluster-containing radical SAM superfamily enzyme